MVPDALVRVSEMMDTPPIRKCLYFHRTKNDIQENIKRSLRYFVPEGI